MVGSVIVIIHEGRQKFVRGIYFTRSRLVNITTTEDITDFVEGIDNYPASLAIRALRQAGFKAFIQEFEPRDN